MVSAKKLNLQTNYVVFSWLTWYNIAEHDDEYFFKTIVYLRFILILIDIISANVNLYVYYLNSSFHSIHLVWDKMALCIRYYSKYHHKPLIRICFRYILLSKTNPDNGFTMIFAVKAMEIYYILVQTTEDHKEIYVNTLEKYKPLSSEV